MWAVPLRRDNLAASDPGWSITREAFPYEQLLGCHLCRVPALGGPHWRPMPQDSWLYCFSAHGNDVKAMGRFWFLSTLFPVWELPFSIPSVSSGAANRGVLSPSHGHATQAGPVTVLRTP